MVLQHSFVRNPFFGIEQNIAVVFLIAYNYTQVTALESTETSWSSAQSYKPQ